MHTPILTGFLFTLVGELVNRSTAVVIDSSALEAKFGCSELSVLANEIKRRDRRGSLAPPCSVYTEIASIIEETNGDIESTLQYGAQMNDMEYWREEQFADYKSRCVGMQNIRGMQLRLSPGSRVQSSPSPCGRVP